MPGLPAATFTFLCADFGHSLRSPVGGEDSPPEAVTQLLGLLARVADMHGGQLLAGAPQNGVATAAFPVASAAVAAVCAIRAALHLAAAGTELMPAVRWALHSGPAVPGEQAAAGSAWRRCRHLLAAGHPGQALLSLVTAELVRDALPAGVSLRELGPFRLKDLSRPETVFQLDSPHTVADFPPLRTLDNLPHNLPVQWTSFVGREPEMAVVRRLLASAPVVTLTGPGGCGKTRLALQVAAAAVDTFPSGAWLVELAALQEPSLVPQALATALGLQEVSGQSLLDTVLRYCRSRQILLMLDNCEHLAGACATLADALLRNCPGVRILATSREPLGVTGEAVYRVAPLALPDPGCDLPLAGLAQYDAVRLFIDRAIAAVTDFTVHNQNAPAVAQICHRLDGIPLAIELAAAWIPVLTVEKIAARLDDRFHLLTGGARTALPRHQTLRAVVDWSYDLLSAAERTMLARLAVFAGGFSLEAAEAVCGGVGLDAGAVLPLLAQLVRKSLVLAEERGGEPRYRMLETLRQYAEGKLHNLGVSEQAETGTALTSAEAALAAAAPSPPSAAPPAAESLQQRHRDWFLALAERAESDMTWSPREQWLARLVLELDNLRAALRFSLDSGQGEAGLRLAAALFPLWMWDSKFSEGREWLAAALQAASGHAGALGRALVAAGKLARSQGDYGQAAALLAESQAICHQAGDRYGEATALHWLGHTALNQRQDSQAAVYFTAALTIWNELGDVCGACRTLVEYGVAVHRLGDVERGAALQEEAITRARQSGDPRLLAFVLGRAAVRAWETREVIRAATLAEEGATVARAAGDRWSLALSLTYLGEACADQGNPAQGVEILGESLSLRRENGDRFYVADTLNALGRVETQLQRFAAAHSHLAESLTLRWEIGDKWGIANALDGLGALAVARGDVERSARLLGSADALWAAIGMPSMSVLFLTIREQARAMARNALGEDRYQSTLAAGRALPLEEAVRYAVADPGTDQSNATPAESAPESATAGGAGPAGQSAAVNSAGTTSTSAADGCAGPALTSPAANHTGPVGTSTAPGGAQAAGNQAGHDPAGAPAGAAPGGLTAREIEIVRLVADGLTDRGVAGRLFISPRTVDTHLRNVFAKVGVTSRTALAAWAIRHGLTNSG